MKKKFKKKKSSEDLKTENVFKNISPLFLICLLIYLFLVVLFNFNEIIVVLFSILFAFIPNLYFFYKDYKKRQEYSKIDLSEISIYEIQKILIEYYKSINYKITSLEEITETEINLTLEKDDRHYLLIIKEYSNLVDIEELQKVLDSKEYDNVNGIIIAINNDFTKETYNFAKKNNLILMNKIRLIELYNEFLKNIDEENKEVANCDTLGEN